MGGEGVTEDGRDGQMGGEGVREDGRDRWTSRWELMCVSGGMMMCG